MREPAVGTRSGCGLPQRCVRIRNPIGSRSRISTSTRPSGPSSVPTTGLSVTVTSMVCSAGRPESHSSSAGPLTTGIGSDRAPWRACPACCQAGCRGTGERGCNTAGCHSGGAPTGPRGSVRWSALMLAGGRPPSERPCRPSSASPSARGRLASGATRSTPSIHPGRLAARSPRTAPPASDVESTASAVGPGVVGAPRAGRPGRNGRRWGARRSSLRSEDARQRRHCRGESWYG